MAPVPTMRIIQLNGQIHAAILGLFAAILHGCTPLYVSEVSITSTPRTQSFDVARLASHPVAVLGVVAPPSLQGFSPSLSLALVKAIENARPTIHAIPGYETLSLLNEQGLAQDYADLISGYASGGILERQRLRRIGSALASRYLMLPGVAEFDQTVIDKFEGLGLKLVRTRLTTLRLWLTLGCSNGSNCLGIEWRSYRGDPASKSQADRSPEPYRAETVVSDDPGGIARGQNRRTGSSQLEKSKKKIPLGYDFQTMKVHAYLGWFLKPSPMSRSWKLPLTPRR